MSLTIDLPHGTLTHFAAPEGEGKPALIICPGGGYAFCSIREGAPVARAFAKDGIESFVLRYDCQTIPLGTNPLHTLSAAVAWVRQNATRFGIDANRIAVGGFSAGGHLAGLHAAVWHRAEWFAPGTDLQAHRPNAAVLCYPVVSAGDYAHRGSFVRLAGKDLQEQQRFSLENLIDRSMPRTFLWHTFEDTTVPVENALLLEAALRKAGVSHELHLFSHGVHGLALADFETYEPRLGRKPDRHTGRWQMLCAEWLKEN